MELLLYSQTLTKKKRLVISAASAIDTNGVSFFGELRKAMEKKGVEASNTNTYILPLLNYLLSANLIN